MNNINSLPAQIDGSSSGHISHHVIIHDGLKDLESRLTVTESQLRNNPSTVTWSAITGKPTSFTPATHNHSINEIIDLSTTLSQKAPLSHKHNIIDLNVSGSASASTFLRGDGTWATPDVANYIVITTSEIQAGTATDSRVITAAKLKEAILNYAAPVSHTHTVSNILTSSGTASSSTYLRGDGTWSTPVNTTYTAMINTEGNAGTSTTARTISASVLKETITTHGAAKIHGHSIDDITDLGTTLNNKAALSHKHDIADINADGNKTNATYLRGDGTWATPTNTTYSAMTQTNADAGTSTTSNLISPSVLKKAIETHGAAKNHTHDITDVNGLQSALDSKVSGSHKHTTTDIIADGTASSLTYLRGDGTWATPPAGEATGGTATYPSMSTQDAVSGVSDIDSVIKATVLKNAITATAAAKNHTHGMSEVTGLEDALSSKAASSHTHKTSDITGLDSALSGKAASSHTHTIANVTGLQAAIDAKAASSHTHAIADTSGLQSALDGKSATGHKHAISDITTTGTASGTTYLRGDGTWATPIDTNTTYSLMSSAEAAAGSITTGRVIGSDVLKNTILSLSASPVHAHTISDITDLQTTLDGKAASTHTHAIADITNLQTTLNSKASATHTHTSADISDAQAAIGTAAQAGKVVKTDSSGQISSSTNPTNDSQLARKAYVDSQIGTKANASHSHAIADITGLQSSLDSKASSSHGHAIADVTNLQSSLNAKAPATHSHNISDLTTTGTASSNTYLRGDGTWATPSGATYPTMSTAEANTGTANNASVITAATLKSTILNFAAPTNHAHTIADITNLQSALDSKAGMSHTHTVANITDFDSKVDEKISALVNSAPATLDTLSELASALGNDPNYATTITTKLGEKANVNHTHTIANVTNLQSSLDSKADGNHKHAIADIDTSNSASSTTYLRGDGQWVTPTNTTYSTMSSAEANAGTSSTGRLIGASVLKDAIQTFAPVATWADLAGKPTTFPADSHTHTISEVTNLQSALDGKAATSHSHTIANITNLQSTLDGKAPTSHTHTSADISDAQASIGATAQANKLVKTDSNGQISSTTNPTSDSQLARKAYVDSQVATKANTSHTHTISDVTGLQSAIDSKAASSHTHTIANVTNLQSTLDSKAASSHSHSVGDITATGSAGSTTYLRGDGTWATPANTNTTYPTMSTSEANAGTASTPSVITAATLKGAVLKFAAPSDHTHTTSNITDFDSKVDEKISSLVNSAPATLDTLSELASALGNDPNFATTISNQIGQKANASHTHTIANITSLQSTLDGKANSSHPHAVGDISTSNSGSSTTYLRGDGQWVTPTNTTYTTMTAAEANAGTVTTGRVIGANVLKGAIQTFAPTPAWADITDKPSTFPPESHTHTIANITNLQSTLDSKAASSHTHTIADVTNLQSSLDAKAASSHTHTIANITNLQSSLNAKADSSHTHAVSDLSTTGSASSTTYLRGDGTWATPPNTNTTYSTMTESEAQTGTSTTARVITATALKAGVEAHGAPKTHSHVIADVTGLQPALTAKMNSSGSANTIWTGSQTAYDALPSATKNAQGFLAVII